MRSTRNQLVTVSLSTLFASAALAQDWTFINLHPGSSEGQYSVCTGASGGQQLGWTEVSAAGIWSGSAGSWHRLTNWPGFFYDWWNPTAIDAGQVVGVGSWSDPPPPEPRSGADALLLRADGSFVYLGNGYSDDISSAAYGISGSRVVGYRDSGPGTNGHAMMWTGPNFSRIDLHPVGASSSVAFGCNADQQVGSATLSGSAHASLWTGTAASWVDLNPDSSTSSVANAVYAGEQVGSCVIGGVRHACLWHDTAESWVDLAPEGAEESRAVAVYGGIQVGYVRIGGVYRASLWHGSADSWVDLSTYLPSRLRGRSEAAGITSNGEYIYVVGTAVNLAGNPRAVLWTPIPCEGDLDGNRTVDLQDLAILLPNYGTPEGAPYGDGDLDSDGDVDLQDLANLLGRFGSTCP